MTNDIKIQKDVVAEKDIKSLLRKMIIHGKDGIECDTAHRLDLGLLLHVLNTGSYNVTLNKLQISGTSLKTEIDVIALAELVNRYSVKTLVLDNYTYYSLHGLSKCSIQKGVLVSLLQKIESNTLKEFKLVGQPDLSGDDIKNSLKKMLTNSSQLDSLEFKSCELHKGKELPFYISIINDYSQIRSLNLDGNIFGSAGLKDIFEALENNTTLTSISLDDNAGFCGSPQSEFDAIQAFFNFLNTNTTIRKIALEINTKNIGAELAEVLASSSVESFSLSDRQSDTNVNILVLQACAKKDKTVRCLRQRNYIKDSEHNAFANAVGSVKIVDLDLRSHQLDVNLVIKIMQAIANNKNNRLEALGINVTAETLKDNNTEKLAQSVRGLNLASLNLDIDKVREGRLLGTDRGSDTDRAYLPGQFLTQLTQLTRNDNKKVPKLQSLGLFSKHSITASAIIEFLEVFKGLTAITMETEVTFAEGEQKRLADAIVKHGNILSFNPPRCPEPIKNALKKNIKKAQQSALEIEKLRDTRPDISCLSINNYVKPSNIAVKSILSYESRKWIDKKKEGQWWQALGVCKDISQAIPLPAELLLKIGQYIFAQRRNYICELPEHRPFYSPQLLNNASNTSADSKEVVGPATKRVRLTEQEMEWVERFGRN